MQQKLEQLADDFQGLADRDTAFRSDHAEAIGRLISTTNPNWETTWALAGLMVSDKTDGMWATIAKKVRGYDVATDGGEQDPLADHKLLEATLGGLALRAESFGDGRTARKLNKQLQRTRARNERMNTNRQRISDYNLDKKELRANLLNKAKMALQSLGCVALASPLAESSLVRRGSMAMIWAGTKSSEIGEKRFRRKIDKLISSKNSS